MFFRKKQEKRSSNLVFVIFRFILSLIIFALLMGGLYSAFQGFSGVDPLKTDPKSILTVLISTATSSKDPKEIFTRLSNLDFKGLLAVKDQSFIPADKSVSSATDTTGKTLDYSFLLIADSHNENNYLQKALRQAQDKLGNNLKFVIGLGDYTEVGTISELNMAKKELDTAGLRYFLIPGDHDLWDGRDKQNNALVNFTQVFGKNYQSFVYQNTKFILIDNADNYKGVSDEQFGWISNELTKAKLQDNAKLIFALLHKPLSHPSSSHIMGSENEALYKQAKSLIMILKEGEVNEVFAGDIHFYTRYNEPVTKLPMTTIGAVASAKNTQAPRYTIVNVFTDSTYSVEDVEIK